MVYDILYTFCKSQPNWLWCILFEVINIRTDKNIFCALPLFAQTEESKIAGVIILRKNNDATTSAASAGFVRPPMRDRVRVSCAIYMQCRIVLLKNSLALNNNNNNWVLRTHSGTALKSRIISPTKLIASLATSRFVFLETSNCLIRERLGLRILKYDLQLAKAHLLISVATTESLR